MHSLFLMNFHKSQKDIVFIQFQYLLGHPVICMYSFTIFHIEKKVLYSFSDIFLWYI